MHFHESWEHTIKKQYEIGKWNTTSDRAEAWEPGRRTTRGRKRGLQEAIGVFQAVEDDTKRVDALRREESEAVQAVCDLLSLKKERVYDPVREQIENNSWYTMLPTRGTPRKRYSSPKWTKRLVGFIQKTKNKMSF